MRDVVKVSQAPGSDRKKEGEMAVLSLASRQAVPDTAIPATPRGNARTRGSALATEETAGFGKAV